MVSALFAKQIDVALVQAPWLEALVSTTASATLDDFKILHGHEHIAGQAFPFLHSTDVYPLPGFIALPGVPPEVCLNTTSTMYVYIHEGLDIGGDEGTRSSAPGRLHLERQSRNL